MVEMIHQCITVLCLTLNMNESTWPKTLNENLLNFISYPMNVHIIIFTLVSVLSGGNIVIKLTEW